MLCVLLFYLLTQHSSVQAWRYLLCDETRSLPITIRDNQDQMTCLEISSSATILQLNQEIRDKLNIGETQGIRMRCGGSILSNHEELIADSGISAEAIIDINVQPREFELIVSTKLISLTEDGVEDDYNVDTWIVTNVVVDDQGKNIVDEEDLFEHLDHEFSCVDLEFHQDLSTRITSLFTELGYQIASMDVSCTDKITFTLLDQFLLCSVCC